MVFPIIRRLPVLSVLWCFVTVTAAEVPYGIGNWPENDRGNHRAVVEVSAPADAVLAEIPWRRRDFSPESKAVLVYDTRTGKRVANVAILSCTQERGEVVFQPVSGAGRYDIYYLPYTEPVHWSGDAGTYYAPEDTAEPEWKQRHPTKDATTLRENLPRATLTRLEARTEFDSFYPMEVPATAAEMTAMAGNFAATDLPVFPEPREFAIRMPEAIPQRWLTRRPGERFNGTARPNEFFAFQLGVWAAHGKIDDLKVEFENLTAADGHVIDAAAFRCVNQEGVDPLGQPFRKKLTVAAGRIQPLWILLCVPADASGVYEGQLKVTADGMTPTTIPVQIRVEGPALADSGVSDLKSLARIAWLDSTRGLDHSILPGFSAVTAEQDTLGCRNRSIRLTEFGLPAAITGNGVELLSSPVEFQILTAQGEVQFTTQETRWTEREPDRAQRISRSAAPDFSAAVDSALEFDGAAFFTVRLRADRDIDLEDLRLSLPFRREAVPYMMGMGKRGGFRPDGWQWHWRKEADNQLWLGAVDAGVQLTLQCDQDFWGYEIPEFPRSWYNGGRGGAEVVESGDTVFLNAYTGSRQLRQGEELVFRFRLLLTPFKSIDPEHWQWRYQSQWGGSGDGEYNIALLFHGDASAGNSFINYPFLETGNMKQYIRNLTRGARSTGYAAAGHFDPRQGAVHLRVVPKFDPATTGAGSPAIGLFGFGRPGGDGFGCHWNPNIHGFSAVARNGYTGLTPRYIDPLDAPFPDWTIGREATVTLSWTPDTWSLWVDGKRLAETTRTPIEDPAQQGRLSVSHHPQLPMKWFKLQSEPYEGGAVDAEPDPKTLLTETFNDDGGFTGTGVAPELYYTVRELSNHAAELWVLRSLNDEIFSQSAVITAPDAFSKNTAGEGYPWLKEHLVAGYAPAWRNPMGSFNDAAIATNGLTRWHNYYIEGMRWLMRECGIKSLYLDGIGYNRDIMRRMAKVMDAENPKFRINFHSGDNYSYNDWRFSPANMYMEHFPYISNLWFGEMFSYDRSPDYWLVEISGIPFGLTGEMLNYTNGGNPYRGMIFGMTGRMHPSARAMWRFWDEFRIDQAEWLGYWNPDCPVRTDRPDVLASVYRQEKRALIALARWPDDNERKQLTLRPGIPVYPSPFVTLGSTAAAETAAQTELECSTDLVNLRIRFRCRFPHTLTAKVQPAGGEVWSDDSLDLYFEAPGKPTVHFIGNALGAKWILKNGQPDPGAGWDYQTRTGEHEWEGSLCIPLNDLGLTLAEGSDSATTNFNVFRTIHDPQLHSSWSPSASYGDSARFGRLTVTRTTAETAAPPKSGSDSDATGLNIDWAKLGLEPDRVRISQPRIDYFQDAREYKVGEKIPIPPEGGALLLLEER